MISISYKKMALAAYLYMVIPITIFFYGWLHPAAFAICTACLWTGLYFLYANDYKDDNHSLCMPKKALLLVMTLIFVWVFISGIGGFTAQMWDLHWRNALMRDLIDYTWPVVYPETGHTLSYYFAYWMVPAVCGKIAGWKAAQLALLAWTMIGVALAALLLLELIQKKLEYRELSFRQSMMVFLVFMGWSGPDFIGGIIADVIDNKFDIGFWAWFDWPIGGFQYASVYTCVSWVFNQAVPAWIATVLWLRKTSAWSVYIFLGLCMVPFSPIPFIGMLALMAGEFLYAWKCNGNAGLYGQIRQCFSKANVLALCSILPVFFLFFKMNQATMGNSASRGGFGIYAPLVDDFGTYFPYFLLFVMVEVWIYGGLVWKEYKTNHLFLAALVLLSVIPIFRVGEGRDFCMRGSIPPLIVLMAFLICWLLQYYRMHLIRGTLLVAVLATTFLSSVVFDTKWRFDIMQRNHWRPVLAEDIYTMSDKTVRNNLGRSCFINFLTPDAESCLFFRSIGKNKQDSDIAKDREVFASYEQKNHLYLGMGWYSVSPRNAGDKYLGVHQIRNSEKIVLVDEPEELFFNISRDAYHIVFENAENKVVKALDVPGNNAYSGAALQLWDVWNFIGDTNPAQRWQLEKIGESYAVRNGKYALTRKENDVCLLEFTGSENQLWNIVKTEHP